MLLHDLRYALRWLRANPGFSSAALFVLALGIGAATATFTIVYSVTLRPLPFAAPDRIVRIWSSPSGRNLPFFSVSAPDALDWRARAATLAVVAPYERQVPFTVTGGAEAEEVLAAKVSRELFDLLGVAPARGRWFSRDEDRDGSGARVAVISHGLWQRRFGGRTDVVGQPLHLDDDAWTVIGVMPASFAIPNNPAEVWLPLALVADPAKRDARYLRVLARLRDGVDMGQADRELAGIAAALAREYPASNRTWTTTVRPLRETVVSADFRRALFVVAIAVGLVLLIACANVASLLLARGASRTREMAVRTALGAGRTALVRQMLVESLVLATLGGALGVLLAMWGLDALAALAITTIPRADEIAVRPVVLLFACGVTTMTAVIFGVAPALGASRGRVDALRVRETGDARGASRVRDLLVVAEVALAMVLLVGAGLMTRSFLRLQQRELGFDPERLLVLQVSPPRNTPSAFFYDALMTRLAALPDVESVAAGNSLPFAGPNGANTFRIQGQTFEPGLAPDADLRAVTPNYFRTLGIPLVRGRAFTAHDNTSAPVVIINATIARRFFRSADPVGQQLQVGGEPVATIVGVVGDVRYRELDDPSNELRPMIYFPTGGAPSMALTVALRTSVAPETVQALVRSTVASVTRDRPITRLEPMGEILATSRGPQRFNATVIGAFAWIAIVLAAAGLWALIAHAVARRTHEIGVRVALGAQPRDVLRMVAGHGVLLASVGIVLGLVAAATVTGGLQRVLFDTPATDPATFAGLAALFLAVAVTASVLPARRALRIDPVEALRSE
jgi:putative ABC transport system permease protein